MRNQIFGALFYEMCEYFYEVAVRLYKLSGGQSQRTGCGTGECVAETVGLAAGEGGG